MTALETALPALRAGTLWADLNTASPGLKVALAERAEERDVPVVVCDFNSPFQGVVDAIGDNPETWFVWCRRGMWRPNVGAKFIERERHFHDHR